MWARTQVQRASGAIPHVTVLPLTGLVDGIHDNRLGRSHVMPPEPVAFRSLRARYPSAPKALLKVALGRIAADAKLSSGR